MPAVYDEARKTYLRNRRQARYEAGICASCESPRLPDQRLCEAHAQRNRDGAARYALELRERVFSAYGDACSCCGERDWRFLTLDHVNDDGAAERAVLGGSQKVYKAAVEEGFPDRYRLLCFNCNLGRARNGGVCPHEEG